MPPKKVKRNRDVEDEELDKKELKAMLKQSFADQAKLKKDNDALKEKVVNERALNIFLGTIRGDHRISYCNPRLPTLLNQFSLGLPCWQMNWFWTIDVDSCSEVVKLFTEGVKVGQHLSSHMNAEKCTSLFRVHLTFQQPLNGYQQCGVDTTVRKADNVVVVGATSRVFSLPFFSHLYLDTWFQESQWLAGWLKNRHHYTLGSKDPQACPLISFGEFPNLVCGDGVVPRLNLSVYNAKINGLLVALARDPDVGHSYKIDLDRMTATRRGAQPVQIGWHPEFEDPREWSHDDEEEEEEDG